MSIMAVSSFIVGILFLIAVSCISYSVFFEINLFFSHKPLLHFSQIVAAATFFLKQDGQTLNVIIVLGIPVA